MPKGRHRERYCALDDYVFEGCRILDYGCGLGFLYPYLSQRLKTFEYVGVDMVAEFIDDAKASYPRGDFLLIGPTDSIGLDVDLVFASGVFNVASFNNQDQSKAWAFGRIGSLFELAGRVLIVDFLSDNVDYRQDEALHFSPSEVIGFITKNLSRRYIIRHDLLPYEFTAIVLRDDSVNSPANTFGAGL